LAGGKNCPDFDGSFPEIMKKKKREGLKIIINNIMSGNVEQNVEKSFKDRRNIVP